jgi:hypothetical protein
MFDSGASGLSSIVGQFRGISARVAGSDPENRGKNDPQLERSLVGTMTFRVTTVLRLHAKFRP